MSNLNPLMIAEASLRANIIKLDGGSFLVAGQNQFLTLWTRDFCHACRGLFALGEVEVIKSHLGFLLENLNSQGLVPRVIDNQLVQFRVAYQSLRKNLPFMPRLKIKEPLIPQYRDEHGSFAIDSNLLVLLVAIELKRRGEEGWWLKHFESLKRVYQWYRPEEGGLITQGAYADWQDSAKRSGHCFLTNLFFYLVSTRLQNLAIDVSVDLPSLKKTIKEKFFDQNSGLYRTHAKLSVISLEGNLFALEAPEFLDPDQKKQLWQSLKVHPLMQLDQGLLGRCSYPEYDKDQIAWHVRLASLERYHGGLAWSWLMGLGLKVAIEQEDAAVVTRMLTKIHSLLIRDKEVVEVYDPNDLWQPWESWLISSERPFSWGAGYLVEALQHLKQPFSQLAE
jgi:hypothetical protein